MKKFLLVTLIGMVLAIDVYGITNELIANYKIKNEAVDSSVTIVYME